MIRNLAEGAETEEESEEADNSFSPKTYYSYGIQESVLRVTYSVMLIVVHVKILNVFSFYSQVAFLVKMIEKIVVTIIPFGLFLGYFMMIWVLGFSALDLIFWNTGAMTEAGDYIGFFGLYGA